MRKCRSYTQGPAQLSFPEISISYKIREFEKPIFTKVGPGRLYSIKMASNERRKSASLQDWWGKWGKVFFSGKGEMLGKSWRQTLQGKWKARL